jgi:alpha-methylacyl-CoA racemase
MAPFYPSARAGKLGPRGTNLLDTGAPFYSVYETADGRYVSVGAIEPPFYRALLDGLELDDVDTCEQMHRDGWAALRKVIAAKFATRTSAEWVAVFNGTDACVAPVLTPAEAITHPHHVARNSFTTVQGRPHPVPAPRFADNPPVEVRPAPSIGEHTHAVLSELGLSPDEVAAAKLAGVVA